MGELVVVPVVVAVRFRLDPELVEAAGLTVKQVEALELYNGTDESYGYRSVGRALDISRDAARDRVERGLRKLEQATRQEAET